MKDIEVIKKTRQLLSEKTNWTQGAFARDEKGSPVSVHNPNACSWCLVGALQIVTGHRLDGFSNAVELIKTKCYRKLGMFNDDTTTEHNDVLMLLDSVITD